ncbi:MAG: hypothetical protein ACE5LU_04130 [Anaerolineae bacterium]
MSPIQYIVSSAPGYVASFAGLWVLLLALGGWIFLAGGRRTLWKSVSGIREVLAMPPYRRRALLAFGSLIVMNVILYLGISWWTARFVPWRSSITFFEKIPAFMSYFVPIHVAVVTFMEETTSKAIMISAEQSLIMTVMAVLSAVVIAVMAHNRQVCNLGTGKSGATMTGTAVGYSLGAAVTYVSCACLACGPVASLPPLLAIFTNAIGASTLAAVPFLGLFLPLAGMAFILTLALFLGHQTYTTFRPRAEAPSPLESHLPRSTVTVGVVHPAYQGRRSLRRCPEPVEGWNRRRLLAWLSGPGLWLVYSLAVTLLLIHTFFPAVLEPMPAGMARIVVREGRFIPTSIAVEPGMTLQWVARGEAPLWLHSGSDNWRLNTFLSSGDTYEYTFEEPGTYRLLNYRPPTSALTITVR